MEDDERYAIASASSGSSALHIWLRTDGSARRSQSGCRPTSPACVATGVHQGHIFSAGASSSGSSAHICAHSLARAAGGPALRSAAPEAKMSAVALAPSAGLLAAAGASGRLYVWALSSGDLIAAWDAHFRAVARLAFTDDEDTLISAGSDASVQAFSVGDIVDSSRQEHSIRPRIALHGHDLPLTALAVGFGGASARVLTVSADRYAKLWHLSSGTCVGTVLLSFSANDATFAADESAAYVGLDSGSVVCISPEALTPGECVSDKNLPTISAPELPDEDVAAVTAVAVSPRGFEVLVGYSDGQIRIYDAESHMQLMVYSKHGDVPISWVGVLYPTPEAVIADAGGLGVAATAVESEDGAAQAFLAPSPRVPESTKSLLFQGALRKAVDPDFEAHFVPKVVVSEADTQSLIWNAINRALDLSCPGALPLGF